MTDNVVLTLIWDSVLIANCWCLVVSPQPTGKSTDTPWSLELAVRSFSLSVERSLLVGQGSHATEGTLTSEERWKLVAKFLSFFTHPRDSSKSSPCRLLGNA